MRYLSIILPVYFTTVVDAQMINGKLTVIDDTTRTYVSHRLYENRNAIFISVSKKPASPLLPLDSSAAITDFQNDGWPDILSHMISCKAHYLYINNHKSGAFTEKMGDYFIMLSLSSMGMDVNDLNNATDGKMYL